MSSSKQILALLQSKAEGDDEQFYSVALQIAAAEARKGRRQVAEEIREAVDNARRHNKPRLASVAIPFAQPRGDLESLLQMRATRLSLADVVLPDVLKSLLADLLRQQFKRDWLREHGKTPNRRLLFVGPPGSGKTMTAEAVAGELKLPLFVIRLEQLITRYMGETAAKLRLVFDETAKRRGVYLFDEFDAVGGRRSAANDVAEMRRVLNSFLQFMEEQNSTDSVIVAATNFPDMLDRALLRRFDTVLEFQFPSVKEIQAIVKANIRPLSFPRPAWKKITAAASGLSQAEISRAAEDAVKTAILDERHKLESNDLITRLDERRRMRDAFGTSQIQ